MHMQLMAPFLSRNVKDQGQRVT